MVVSRKHTLQTPRNMLSLRHKHQFAAKLHAHIGELPFKPACLLIPAFEASLPFAVQACCSMVCQNLVCICLLACMFATAASMVFSNCLQCMYMQSKWGPFTFACMIALEELSGQIALQRMTYHLSAPVSGPCAAMSRMSKDYM